MDDAVGGVGGLNARVGKRGKKHHRGREQKVRVLVPHRPRAKKQEQESWTVARANVVAVIGSMSVAAALSRKASVS
jgi:hypothetical protein